MPGTVEGGKQAGKTNKRKYGKDFYAKIGAMGGKLGKTGGFGSPLKGADGMTGKERASVMGVIGGRKSRRGKRR